MQSIPSGPPKTYIFSYIVGKITSNIFQSGLANELRWGGGLSVLVCHSSLIELQKFSITLNIKTLECRCGIDLSDRQSCLTVWTDCLPLDWQPGPAAELISRA